MVAESVDATWRRWDRQVLLMPYARTPTCRGVSGEADRTSTSHHGGSTTVAAGNHTASMVAVDSFDNHVSSSVSFTVK